MLKTKFSLIMVFVVLGVFTTATIQLTHAESYAPVPCPEQGVWPDGCAPTAPIAPPTDEPCPVSGKWPAGCVPTSPPPVSGVPCPTSGKWPPGCVPSTQPPPPTPWQPSLAINNFTATMTPLTQGRESIEFKWDTTGADSVILWIGFDPDNNRSRKEFVGAAGEVSLVYNEPILNGHVGIRITSGDQVVEREMALRFNCEFEYVFNFDWLPVDDQPAYCPSAEAETAAAAYQLFENGFMVWVQDDAVLSRYRYAPPSDNIGHITVFIYGDRDDGSRTDEQGNAKQFDDLWRENDPPPPVYSPPRNGLQQPIRGFGKVWHERSHIREALGWAIASEQSYTMQYQYSKSPTYEFPIYHTLPTNDVMELWGGYSWREMLP